MATTRESLKRPQSQRGDVASGTPSETDIRRIVACLDGSELGERVAPHAVAIAAALGAPLTLLRVLEGRPAGDAPPDPLEWDIRRREAREYVERFAQERSGEDGAVGAEIVEGQAAEQICLWVQHHEVDLTILCTHGMSGKTEWSLASTARKLIDRVPGSLLLVPAAGPVTRVAHYGRLLVPVDGSPRAESVLPLATRLAVAHGAELILAHVVPVPELTEIGPLDAEDLELQERLVRRNERVAREYLDRLRARLAESGLSLRALVIRGGDVASRLARLITDEAVDLVVLSSHGRSCRSEVPCGSVAAYLITHAETPLLIVRQRPASPMQRVSPVRERASVRLPSQATP